MDKKTLETVREKLIVYISNISGPEIDCIDKFELMRNLNNFLDPCEYDENIKVLNKHILENH
jgi:hypothetical protein